MPSINLHFILSFSFVSKATKSSICKNKKHKTMHNTKNTLSQQQQKYTNRVLYKFHSVCKRFRSCKIEMTGKNPMTKAEDSVVSKLCGGGGIIKWNGNSSLHILILKCSVCSSYLSIDAYGIDDLALHEPN